MSGEIQDFEKIEKETVVITQPSNAVVVQPGRPLPGQWSTGLLFNGPCCISMLVPWLQCIWAVEIGHKESFLTHIDSVTA